MEASYKTRDPFHHMPITHAFLLGNPTKSPKIDSKTSSPLPVCRHFFLHRKVVVLPKCRAIREGRGKGSGSYPWSYQELSELVIPGSALSQNTSRPSSSNPSWNAAVSFCYPFTLYLKQQQQFRLLRIPGFGERVVVLKHGSFYALKNL